MRQPLPIEAEALDVIEAKSTPTSRSSRIETRLRDFTSASRNRVGPKNLPL